jgi:hypothetical protein
MYQSDIKESIIGYYDRTNNVILNRELTHVAVLLSQGWYAPRYSVNDTKKLFDVAKIMQILPNNKLPNVNTFQHAIDSVDSHLFIHWVPVHAQFIVYYIVNNGEYVKLEASFRYKA